MQRTSNQAKKIPNGRLNSTAREETFRLNLDLINSIEEVTGAEEDNGKYYVNIDYRQAYNATALGSLKFTRTGYTPDKIMLGEKTIATYADGAWTVVGDTYTLTTDSTIDVTWTLDSDYYVATMEDQKKPLQTQRLQLIESHTHLKRSFPAEISM